MAEYATSEDVRLFATSTGDLYPRFCNMARRKAPISRWISFVHHTVWAQYRHEVDDQALVRTEDLTDAAKYLQAYYVAHVSECI